jgi:hypothetical protein
MSTSTSATSSGSPAATPSSRASRDAASDDALDAEDVVGVVGGAPGPQARRARVVEYAAVGQHHALLAPRAVVSPPVFAEIAARFGKRLGVDVATTPGTHATCHEHPHELAEIIRPFLGEVGGART